jgi:4-aminobutyrate aminotransferase
MAAAPSQGDVNRTPLRAAWQREQLDEPSRALLARDGAAFLHQSVSTPCLAPIVLAEGLFIEDLAGRRYRDFHGNNVHHLGHGHPEVIAAIKRPLDDLSFAQPLCAAARGGAGRGAGRALPRAGRPACLSRRPWATG